MKQTVLFSTWQNLFTEKLQVFVFVFAFLRLRSVHLEVLLSVCLGSGQGVHAAADVFRRPCVQGTACDACGTHPHSGSMWPQCWTQVSGWMWVPFWFNSGRMWAGAFHILPLLYMSHCSVWNFFLGKSQLQQKRATQPAECFFLTSVEFLQNFARAAFILLSWDL